MRITRTFWFTQSGGPCIGIVIGEDENTGEKKAYVGTADGIDEELDAKSISRYGGKLNEHTVQQIAAALSET